MIQVVDTATSGPYALPFLQGQRPSSALVGLSLKNRMANRRCLEELIPWVKERAVRVLVVVGDFPHRHNLMALRGLSANEALTKAMRDGRQTLRAARSVASATCPGGGVTVCSASELIETASCRTILRALETYYEKGGDFVLDVLSSAMRYARRVGDPARFEMDEAIPRLKQYLLEEIAMFLHLSSTGFDVEVYPGPDLGLMRAIAQASYDSFPYSCPHRTHISVSVKPARQEGSEQHG